MVNTLLPLSCDRSDPESMEPICNSSCVVSRGDSYDEEEVEIATIPESARIFYIMEIGAQEGE